MKAGIVDTEDLQTGKYQQTMLGKVGGPDGPPNVVVLAFEGQKPIAMDMRDAKQLVYDMVRTMRYSGDPVAEELFQAFKGVFTARAEKREIH